MISNANHGLDINDLMQLMPSSAHNNFIILGITHSLVSRLLAGPIKNVFKPLRDDVTVRPMIMRSMHGCHNEGRKEGLGRPSRGRASE